MLLIVYLIKVVDSYQCLFMLQLCNMHLGIYMTNESSNFSQIIMYLLQHHPSASCGAATSSQHTMEPCQINILDRNDWDHMNFRIVSHLNAQLIVFS